MKGRKKLFFGIIFVVILIWAVFVRFWGVSNRGLWMDEASAANVILQRSALDALFQTDVPMAPAFGFVAKMITQVISPPEIGLRLFSMVCGVLCVLLIYLLMRNLRMTPFVSLVAMALGASCPWLVIWSRSFKPYIVEAMFSVLLALLVFKIRRCSSQRKKTFIAIAIVIICFVAPWFGYGFVFVAAPLLAVLLFLTPINSSQKFIIKTGLIASAAIVLSTVTLWYLIAAKQASLKGTQHFNNLWFIEITSLKSWARAIFYTFYCNEKVFLPDIKIHYTTHRILHVFNGLGVILVSLFGLYRFPRKAKIEVAAWAIIPWILMLLAAILQKYPFASPRLSVVLAPAMIVVFTYGMVSLLRSLCRVRFGYSGIGIFAGLILSLVPVSYMINAPLKNLYYINHNFRTILPVLYEQRKKNETVVVSLYAVHSVKLLAKEKSENFIYTPCEGHTPADDHDFNYEAFAQEVVNNAGERWWLLTVSLKEISHDLLKKEAVKQGYNVELISEQNSHSKKSGYAQLFLIERNRKKTTGY